MGILPELIGGRGRWRKESWRKDGCRTKFLRGMGYPFLRVHGTAGIGRAKVERRMIEVMGAT